MWGAPDVCRRDGANAGAETVENTDTMERELLLWLVHRPTCFCPGQVARTGSLSVARASADCGLVDALHPCNGLSPERKPTIENVGAQRQEIPPVNTIVLIGNLTKNPDLRHTTQRATSVAHLTIASDRSRKADAKTDFFSCEAWALLAEQVNANFAKGDFVRVTGYVKLDEYEVNGEKRRTATIVARKVEKVEKTEAHAELDVQPAE